MLYNCLLFCFTFLAGLTLAVNYTTSGLSSGGFFTVQLGVAWSSEVTGVGVVAGGPYYCAEDKENEALTACMSIPTEIHLNTLENDAKSAANANKIDPLSNIANQRIYLYSGTMDYTVNSGVVKKANQWYQDFGATTHFENDIASAHGMVTNFYGNPCYKLGEPYIQNCKYDLAGVILKYIYNDRTLKPAIPNNEVPYNNVIKIDQTKFIPSGSTAAGISVETKAYAYVPTNCQIAPIGNCSLHVVFHGCEQDLTSSINFNTPFNDTYVRKTGYNGWAEVNSIVILYPQATTETIKNPNGCWDWWGYNTKNYAYKDGKQVNMVHNMIMWVITGSNEWFYHKHENKAK